MTKTMSVRVTDEEWDLFHEVCASHHVSVQDLLHGMVTDAIMDEEYAIQCRRQERRTAGRKAG